MEEAGDPRKSRALAILAALTIGGSAVAVIIYQSLQRDRPPADASGFNLSQTQVDRHSSTAPNTLPKPLEPQDSLSLLKAGELGPMRTGEGGPGQAGEAAQEFTDLTRQNEGKVVVIAQRYTKQYASIAHYGKDWMSYPDLKKLNDDYMLDHDPIRFLHGLAQSRNFGKLVVRYAGDPAVQSFVKESLKEAPGRVITAATSLLKEDAAIKDIIANTAAALGLPPALTAGILGAGQVDQKQVLGQIMTGDPEVRKALQDPEASRRLRQPAEDADRRR